MLPSSYPIGFLLILCLLSSCQFKQKTEDESILLIQKEQYHDQLEGFWLGQSIANWTGLVTEMDKIGNIGDIKTGAFYTRADWGQPDQANIWSEDGEPSNLSATIDFVFADTNEVWGSDDDTDIEYLYQHLLHQYQTCALSGEQIQQGWLKHIKKEEENFLWVSNQAAFDLMQDGILPPETSAPERNPHYAMIDAQLTTEIFGLLAPGQVDHALAMAYLPIRTSARQEAAEIAEFYVIMHALAPTIPDHLSSEEQNLWLARNARKHLSEAGYPAKMYDYVLIKYQSGIPWEQTRDSVYQRYQVEGQDGYDISAQELYCNGCFAAGINFAAGMISWFYGKGDLKETIKTGVLMGWDADNPTATWGGLLGFIYGKKRIEQAFGRRFSNQFNIHRTRQNFPKNGLDNFSDMAGKGMTIIEHCLNTNYPGSIDRQNNLWRIPISLD